MKTVLLFIIKIYRAAVAPLFGPCCRFYPSCSAYAEEAIYTLGVINGVQKAIKRICRCHPFNRGGYDPVNKEGTIHG